MSSGDVSYSRRWNFARHQPIDRLTPDQAAVLDGAGELYTVALAGSVSNIPEAVIEVVWGNDHANVWFFDDEGRRTLRYSFRRLGERLFLHAMTEWHYPDGSGSRLSDASRIDGFGFDPDGAVSRSVKDAGTGRTSTEDRRGVDVSAHWEPVPEFGRWSSLARWQRATSET